MITLGNAEQFQVVRSFLRERFNEEIVAACLGVASVGEFDQRDSSVPIRDTLTRVLFGGAAAPEPEWRAAVRSDVTQALLEMGVLARTDGHIWATVIVYPLWGLHFISDRFTMPDGTPFQADREFVYFALTANTQRFVASLPDSPCESFLDIGAGCGAAALVQSRCAKTSVAADIAGRSALFADFNRLLNGIDNVESLEGSLYEPVAGRRFDRIACHPPYDISSATPWTFADGGADGETVIRGVISGLPDHLAEGGEFITQFRAADREDKPLHLRVREWLGAAGDEFDIAMIEREMVGLQDYALSVVYMAGGSAEQTQECLRNLQAGGTVQFVYCQMLIRRRGAAGEPVTFRRRLGRNSGYAELRWLLENGNPVPVADWRTARVVPSAEMNVVSRYRPSAKGLVAVEHRLMTQAPFMEDVPCPPWMPALLNLCSGERTGGEIYNLLNQNARVDELQFSAALGWLSTLGAIEVQHVA